MEMSFPNESAEYRAARNRLLDQEIALRRQMEALAEARRALPPGGEVTKDYVFDRLGEDGAPTKIRLSELFRPGADTLMIYQYMFPRWPTDNRETAATGETARLPQEEAPCPSCTVLLDALDRAAPQFEARGANFAVVAKTTLDRLLGVARDREWRHLRLLSSAGNDFRRDYHGEDDQGRQLSLMSVFTRDAGGTIRHFWSSELTNAPKDPGQDPRALGVLDTFWNMLDLTPGGRPDISEQLQYNCCQGAVPATLKGG